MVTHHPAILGSHKHYGTGDVLKEFVSLTMVAMEMWKKDTLSVIVATVAKRIKYFIKNINLLHSKHHCQNCVDWASAMQQKIL